MIQDSDLGFQGPDRMLSHDAAALGQPVGTKHCSQPSLPVNDQSSHTQLIVSSLGKD